MSRGLDSNSILTDHAECLAKAGFSWTARYAKETASALTHAEAKALSAAGLQIVTVVERGFPTEASYFSHAKGEEDGKWAYDYAHTQLKQPSGSAIYFAVDMDASLAEANGAVKAYFEAIHEAFDAASSGKPAYSVGVYGSGLTCKNITQSTPTPFSWLAMSRGWRGSRNFTGWSIAQTKGSSVCGVAVDEDVGRGHFGQWRL